jgi:hypothetical protein
MAGKVVGKHALFDKALEDLLRALDDLAADRKKMARRAELIRRQLRTGCSLSEVVHRERRPLIVETMRGHNNRIVEAFSRRQRAEATALQEEGVSMEHIGNMFGLSRQRVADLVRPRKKA